METLPFFRLIDTLQYFSQGLLLALVSFQLELFSVKRKKIRSEVQAFLVRADKNIVFQFDQIANEKAITL